MIPSFLPEVIMTGAGLALASSSFSYQWTYDVFINFRGEDTRHGFTGNLHNALKKAGVCTFFDDKEVKRGDEIKPALVNEIENSRMAITVFSKNYASSTFCLDELVQIHECVKRKGRLVLPIFYDVEPSEVRHQMGNYKKDLSMHMEKRRADEDKIQRWKVALHEVADISGLHFSPGKNGYEYQFIETIVKEISSKINRVPIVVSEYPVGLESRVKEITSLLKIGSNDKVMMVGICGIGGVGKTTIARALYNSIADNFEGLCFLHDVKGKSKKLGLEGIQEIILSKIVGLDIKIQDVNEGVQVIKKRFKEKKILLILDNVENHEQLKKLAGGCNWFSDGSRIIITTRDEQLLVAHGVEGRYNMEVLNAEESLELLRWNAFRNRQVDSHYMDVLNRAVTYAQGLPLALEVIGSNLCGKTINEWESALDAYKLSHKDIQQVLRLSYEVLEEVEKEIFLDIACLFNGENLQSVKYMVEAVHDYDNLSYSIGVLVDKCLIKIEKLLNRIQMHDLIQDMGRKIVCEESPDNPGERSRLWLHQDIVDVLECNTGTNKVRMIGQDNWSECIEVNWDGEAFKSMKELKILIFENVKFLEGPKYLPKSLKVLKWRGYPSSCLPSNFSPKKLVVFDMGLTYLSSQTITETSDNLGILNLKGCEYVKEIPDLSNLRNLKELSLMHCENLIEIHDSIGYLPKLEILDVGGCVRLKTFPRAIKLPSLTILGLERCRSLKYFPEILDKVKIRKLILYGTGIEKLPWSICNLSELRQLRIDQKNSVIEIPNSIFLLPEIKYIKVNSIGKVVSCNSKEGQEHAIWSKQCPNGVEFILPRCNISDDVVRTDLSRYMNVQHLDLSFNNFTILPVWIKECHYLETLVLNECVDLREVEGIPPSIRWLEATNCVSLSLESKSIILSEEIHGAPDRYNYNSKEPFSRSQSIILSEELHGAPGTYNYNSEEPFSRSQSIISSEELDGALGRYNYNSKEPFFFYVPTRSIPKWFDHRSKGASISFWFRNSFPLPLCLCLLLKPADVESEFCSFDVRVDINEAPAFCYRETRLLYEPSYYLDDYHLVVCCLEEDHIIAYDLEFEDLIQDRWYHAQVCVLSDKRDKGSVIKEIGMYVIKQLCEMKDITFTNPYHQTLDSTWGNQAEQVLTRMEEKEVAVNKRRGLMGDYNFASSSTAFICTKRARNCPINQDNNDTITPQVPFVKALEIINNNPAGQVGTTIEMPSNVTHLVGDIQLKVNRIISLLKMELNDTCFIGIWGESGIGKTTLARLVYDKIQSQFDTTCFLDNVREDSDRVGVFSLQKKLLSELGFGEFDIDVFSEGAKIIRKFLGHKKVLIILDDVSERSQLENLAGNKEWFGVGSKILITTKDKTLLKLYGQFEEYEVGRLHYDESLKLLCRVAFKKDEPEDGYLDLSKEVIEYSRGLPLVLKVLGSFLCKKDQNEWRNTSERLRQNSATDISSPLHISYDGLEDEEYKRIFLDIACFFNWDSKFKVTNILELCDLHSTIGIEVLIEKSMLNVTHSNSDLCQNAKGDQDMFGRIQRMRKDIFLPTYLYDWLLQEASKEYLHMHDLLQKMGRDIVFHKSPTNAGGRNRLWSLEDIDLVLKENKGTKHVQSIVLKTQQGFKAVWDPNCFSKMINLRLLDMSNVHLLQKLESLPTALKFLRWDDYAQDCLPSIEKLCNLESLQLCNNNIQKLWEGNPVLNKLRIIDMSGSESLSETPDFSGTPNLEELLLNRCRKLVRVHESVGQLRKLIKLSLKKCKRLEFLPTKLETNNLQEFILMDCIVLEKLPEFGRNMGSLYFLDVRGTNITEIPQSIIHLTNLKCLDLTLCSRLKSIPELPPNLILSASNCGLLEPTSALRHLYASCVPKGPIHLFYDFQLWTRIPTWFERWEYCWGKDTSGEFVTITADVPSKIVADSNEERWGIAVCVVFQFLSQAWQGFSVDWKFNADTCHPNKTKINGTPAHYMHDCRVYVGFYPFEANDCRQHASREVSQLDLTLDFPATNIINGLHDLKIMGCGWRLACKKDFDEQSESRSPSPPRLDFLDRNT